MSNEAVVIKCSGNDPIQLRYVQKGTPFWYKRELYQRTNSDIHNSLRLVDGCLSNLHFSCEVIPTTIEIHVKD